MSTLTVQNIQGSSSSSNTINVASGHKITGAAGSIVAPGAVIQFQHVNFSDTTTITTTGTNYTDITGATISITPKFTSSKIFILTDLSNYASSAGTTYVYSGIRIVRGSSTVVSPLSMSDGNGPYDYGIGQGDTGPQHDSRKNITAYDAPNTTSAVTYKIQAAMYAAGSITFNYTTGTSNLFAMEVAQ